MKMSIGVIWMIHVMNYKMIMEFKTTYRKNHNGKIIKEKAVVLPKHLSGIYYAIRAGIPITSDQPIDEVQPYLKYKNVIVE